MDVMRRLCAGDCGDAPTCILNDFPIPSFESVIPDAFRAEHGQLKTPDQFTSRQRRWCMYFYYAKQVYGVTGRDCRCILPACVVRAIRRAYPNDEGVPYVDHISVARDDDDDGDEGDPEDEGGNGDRVSNEDDDDVQSAYDAREAKLDVDARSAMLGEEATLSAEVHRVCQEADAFRERERLAFELNAHSESASSDDEVIPDDASMHDDTHDDCRKRPLPTHVGSTHASEPSLRRKLLPELNEDNNEQ